MVTVIKGGEVYAPERIGRKDILVVNGKIVAIDNELSVKELRPEILDARGMVVCSGFIDQHVHITGGGGQFGFDSFIPELTAADLLGAGTTTVVGLLGTDGYIKELTTLYGKTKALDQSGVTAYMLTNFYGLPEKTICGSVAEDLIFIDKVIGCKLAISDDRSSFPTRLDVLRLINQVRLGGFTSGKGGVLHIHLGILESKIDVLLSIAEELPSFISYLSPTHCSRTKELFEACLEFAALGGMIDVSTGGTTYAPPYEAIAYALEKKASLNQLTFSSDGNGGVKRINPDTCEVSYTPAPLDTNYKEVKKLVEHNILRFEEAIKLITVNPAKNLKLRNKGMIRPGYDADFVLLDDQYQIRDVISRGEKYKVI